MGHQFGNLAGQLGDGRAISLGDVRNSKGELWDIQFKGAGKTPYSRTADGRAVLRSSIREFLASEHLYFLGVPTTRALSCVQSTDTVPRDIKYNGNVRDEKCTVVIRLAPTFIRFGSFQLALKNDYNPQRGGDPSKFDVNMIRELADYTIKYFYPQFASLEKPEATTQFLLEVANRTLDLFVQWQGIGFIHGVLNTDNMSILGLTIDYGPFGFMEYFDEFQVINTSDEWGRYAYKKQPEIAKWNLNKLFECFDGILPADCKKRLRERLSTFENECSVKFNALMCKKVGLIFPVESFTLASLLKDCMEYSRTDWTNFFLILEKFSDFEGVVEDPSGFFAELWKVTPTYSQWLKLNTPSIPGSTLEALLGNRNMQAFFSMQYGHFPEAYLQNQAAKSSAKMQATADGEDIWRKDVQDRWMQWLGLYADHIREDKRKFSESQMDKGGSQSYAEERVKLLTKTNPAFILRNHLIQDAITKAESGDFSEVDMLLKLSCSPFDRNIDPKYQRTPSECTGEICLSCSS